MSATNRAALINKLYKVAKKQYAPILPPSTRTVWEHMMFACCLNNSQYEAADESFARLQEQFFDWNEVRVTTAVELAEVMKQQPDPAESAVLLKKALHGIFETYYNFDLEALKLSLSLQPESFRSSDDVLLSNHIASRTVPRFTIELPNRLQHMPWGDDDPQSLKFVDGGTHRRYDDVRTWLIAKKQWFAQNQSSEKPN